MDKEISKHTSSSTSLSAKVLRAMSVFSGVQALSIICSIIRTKLIAIWISTDGIGLFAIYNSVVEMLSAVTQLNLRQSAVRDITSSSRSRLPFIAGVVRWWASRLGLLGVIIMIALSPLLSIISFGDLGHWWGFALLSVTMYALSFIAGEQALMQGTDDLKSLAKSSLIGAIGGTIISIPMYYWLGLWSIIPSIIIFSIMGAVGVISVPRVHSTRNTTSDNVTSGREFMKLGLWLTASTAATTVASYIFVSYLNQHFSTSTTGVFQAGYTLVIRYTGIIFTALAMEFFPRVTKVSMNPRMTSVVVSHEVLLVLYVLTPLCVAFVMADELAVRILYTEQFMAMLPFVTIGMMSMLYRGISYCMAYVIISRGDGKVYLILEISSALIGLAINIVMFSRWSYVGLGLSYILWYMIYLVMVWIVYHKYGMRLNAASLKLSVCSTLILACSILLKSMGWIYVTPTLAASVILSAYGYLKLKK